jgi:hypothetical protein
LKKRKGRITEPSGIDEMITEVDNLLPAGGLVKKGGRIVITVRAPLLGSGKTNLLKLHRIGEGNLRADRGASPSRDTTAQRTRARDHGRRIQIA